MLKANRDQRTTPDIEVSSCYGVPATRDRALHVGMDAADEGVAAGRQAGVDVSVLVAGPLNGSLVRDWPLPLMSTSCGAASWLLNSTANVTSGGDAEARLVEGQILRRQRHGHRRRAGRCGRRAAARGQRQRKQRERQCALARLTSYSTGRRYSGSVAGLRSPRTAAGRPAPNSLPPGSRRAIRHRVNAMVAISTISMPLAR